MTSHRSETLVASQELKVPAFQYRHQPSAAAVSDSPSSQRRPANIDVQFDDGLARRSDVTPSSAPAPVMKGTASRIKKHPFVASTMPISFPVYSDSEIPPPRKLPFATKRVGTDENANRMAVTMSTAQKRPELIRDSTNVSPSQRSMVKKCPQTEFSGIVQDSPTETTALPSLTADDIDTQNLLAQVAKRESRSRNAKPNLEKKSPQIADASQGTQSASQKKKNKRCQTCQSAHRRCMKDSKTPGGSCLPCSKAGKECSLVSDHEITVDSGAISLTEPNVQPVVPVRSCGPRRPSVAISTHRNEIADGPEISLTDPQLENSGIRFGSQTGWKRRSESTMPPPLSKRLKQQPRQTHEEGTFDVIGNNKERELDKRSNMSLPQIRKPLSLRKTANRSSSVHLRSDATTATADTDDLNRTPKRLALRCQRQAGQLGSDRPAFSEISELAEVQLEVPNTTTVQSDNEVEVVHNISEHEVSCHEKLLAQPQELVPANMTFPRFLGLDRDGQDTIMRDFICKAITDENFLDLCKRLQGLPGFSVLNGKI